MYELNKSEIIEITTTTTTTTAVATTTTVVATTTTAVATTTTTTTKPQTSETAIIDMASTETESSAVTNASKTMTAPTTNIMSSAMANTTITVTTTSVPPTATFVFEATIKLNYTFPSNKTVQEELKKELKSKLTEQFKDVAGFIDVIINGISNGSLLVNYAVITQENAGSSLNDKIIKIKDNGLNLFNKTAYVLSASQVECTDGCEPHDDNIYLEIGLGIGIPLLIIVILILVKVIWFRRKNAFAAQLLDNSDIYNTQQAYGSLSSVFQSKHLAINSDFESNLRANAWEEDTSNNSNLPGFYLSAMLQREGSFKIARPKLY